jgi:hypothetical protein
MTARVLKLSTAASTNLTLVKDGPANVKGLIGVNTAAYAIFVKLYWYIPTAAAPAPTVGTTIPDVTIEVGALGTATGGIQESWPDGFTKSGQLYLAVTKLAADNDATAVVAGDGILTLLYE